MKKVGVFVILVLFLFISVNASVPVEIKTYKDAEFTQESTVFKDGDTVYVSASNSVSCCNSVIGNILYNGMPQINIELFDDGENEDDTEDDGLFKSSFKVGSGENDPNNYYVHAENGDNVIVYVALTTLSTGQVQITTDYTKPTTVSLNSNLNGLSVELNYDNANDANGIARYYIYRSQSPITEQNKNNAQRFATESNTYTDNTVTDGNTYYYAVAALDNTGNIAPLSNVEEINTPDLTAPQPVTQIQILAKKAGEISLFWNEPTDNIGVEEYIIFRDTKPITNLNQVSEHDRTTSKSFSEVSSQDGIRYYYAVSAVDAAGNKGSITESPSAVVDALPPNKITNFTAKQKAEGEIELSWHNIGVEKYILYYDTDFNLEDGTSVEFDNETFTYSFYPGQTYNYAITSEDKVGNVAQLSEIITIEPDSTGPEAVKEFSVIPHENLTNSLSWINPEEFDHVQIYRNQKLILSTDESSYTDKNIFHGVEYIYQIITVDELGNLGNASDEIKVKAQDLLIELIINYPKNKAKFANELLIISGKTENYAKVIINSNNKTFEAIVDNAGNFLGYIDLELGVNVINITSYDLNENFASKIIEIERLEDDNRTIINNDKNDLVAIIEELQIANKELLREINMQNAKLDKSEFLKLSQEQKDRLKVLAKQRIEESSNLAKVADEITLIALKEFKLSEQDFDPLRLEVLQAINSIYTVESFSEKLKLIDENYGEESEEKSNWTIYIVSTILIILIILAYKKYQNHHTDDEN